MFVSEIKATLSKTSRFVARRPLVLGGLLAVATMLLYLPVVQHEFLNVWDDDVYITKNVHVCTGISLSNLGWAFTTVKPFYWQPLTLISHMVVCQLFGLNSGAHHYVNVLLHALNALILFLLLQRATGAVSRSFLVAALFAVHPTNVETVAWTAERNTLLCTLFSMLAVVAYGWYTSRGGWKRYMLVITGFSLALMSKPTAVILPVILLLVDYWPLKRCKDQPFLRRWGWLLLEKLPLFSIGVGASVFAMYGEHASQTLMSFTKLPMAARVENALQSYVAYIGNMLAPIRLSPFYPHPIITIGPSLPLAEVAASCVVLIAITTLAIYPRPKPYALMGWLLFLTTLLPVIGLVQTGSQARQDHFTYIPCIGLFILVVWGLSALIEGVHIPRPATALASLLLLVVYAGTTVHYLKFWQNAVKLFGYARSVPAEANPMLELLYGTALYDAGRADEALAQYRQSCALAPGNEHCHFFIAEILFDRREFVEAVREYQLTLMLTSNRDRALACLNKSAEALLNLGEISAADSAIEGALKIDPNNATALSLRRKLQGRAN